MDVLCLPSFIFLCLSSVWTQRGFTSGSRRRRPSPCVLGCPRASAERRWTSGWRPAASGWAFWVLLLSSSWKASSTNPWTRRPVPGRSKMTKGLFIWIKLISGHFHVHPSECKDTALTIVCMLCVCCICVCVCVYCIQSFFLFSCPNSAVKVRLLQIFQVRCVLLAGGSSVWPPVALSFAPPQTSNLKLTMFSAFK